MKKTILLYLMTVLLVGVHTSSSAQQNHLFTGSFEACKAQAAKENKMIVIDLYFEGCMPCKQMDDQVFPDPAVVKLLTPDFILFKTDVFKEEDGMKLARKYGASGFPTYVMVDAAGKAMLIEAGFFAVDRFVPLLQKAKALRDAGQFLAFDTDLDKKYPAYYNHRYMRKGEKGEIAELRTYLQGKDLSQEVPFVVSTLVNDAEINQFVYANLPLLVQKYSSTLLLNKVNTIAGQKLQEHGQLKQLDGLKKTLDYIRPVYNDRLWTVFMPSFIASYYKGGQDADAYLTLAESYDIFPTWAHRSNALGEVIIAQKDNAVFLERLKKEYLTEQRKSELDNSDQYKLSLIYAYLGDYQAAAASLQPLLTLDLSSPMYALKSEDVQALQAAIAKKDLRAFQAKNVKKAIPMKMD